MPTKQILMRIPPSLDGHLLASALKHKMSVQSVVTEILARHYKIEIPQPKCGRPRSRNNVDD